MYVGECELREILNIVFGPVSHSFYQKALDCKMFHCFAVLFLVGGGGGAIFFQAESLSKHKFSHISVKNRHLLLIGFCLF